MATPYLTFKLLFQLKNIKNIYKDNISKKATRGIDKIGIKIFNKNKDQHLKIIYKKCNSGTYVFSPYVQKLKVKGKNKTREISVPTIRDRIVQSLLKDFLHEIYPECVNRRLPNNYIREIKEFYDNNDLKHFCYVKIDIKSFYDKINHDILIKLLKEKIKSERILDLLRRSIKTPTVPINYKHNDKVKYKRTLGVAQGLSISNILANIYLKKLDEKLGGHCLKYFRYVDDILIFIEDNGSSEVITLILNDELTKYKLEINEEKTDCNLTNCSFDYLGYKVSLPKVSIKDSNVERFITSIAAKFSAYHHNSESQLKKYTWLTKEIRKQVFIEDLNEKITGALSENKRYGWLFYFLEINDMQLLHKLDSIIEKFFGKLDDFGYVTPHSLKKLSKAYYKAKRAPYDGYIHNYEKYDSLKEKIDYLSNRGYLNPKGNYKKEDIEAIFNRVKRRRLSDLELDVGIIS